jgi:hypothetical protein
MTTERPESQIIYLFIYLFDNMFICGIVVALASHPFWHLKTVFRVAK